MYCKCIFLHKSGAVRSVDCVLMIGVPLWLWLGEYVTHWTKHFGFLLKQEVVAVPSQYHIFILNEFLEAAFIITRQAVRMT